MARRFTPAGFCLRRGGHRGRADSAGGFCISHCFYSVKRGEGTVYSKNCDKLPKKLAIGLNLALCHTMSSFPFRTSVFNSTEAADVADISTTNQRNLRRHKYLDSNNGKWARYSLDELCSIATFGCLLKRGIPPQICKYHARKIGEHLADFAINNPEAVEGWQPQRPGVFLHICDDRNNAEEWFFENGFPARFFVILGQNARESFLADSLDAHFNEREEDLSGSIVIDLKRLGALIAKRAGRHLASILPAVENTSSKKAAA
jgi:hypothetical protein